MTKNNNPEIIIEEAIDVLFDSIYTNTMNDHIIIKDGMYVVEVQVKPAPMISGNNRVVNPTEI